MNTIDWTPILKVFEELYVENRALRMTLSNLPQWDDDAVNANKEKARQVLAPQFAVLYQHARTPRTLDEILAAILRVKKPN